MCQILEDVKAAGATLGHMSPPFHAVKRDAGREGGFICSLARQRR